eukprot:Hpha_TRINITY_DN17457_c0_g1::TRINITY_DN17457_c0_g1_i1::g.85836::m.85836/K08336/ATG12; ubiquitin-like protein ATG12
MGEPAAAAPAPPTEDKVKVQVIANPGTSQLAKKVVMGKRNWTVAQLSSWLKKQLQLQPRDALFVYCSKGFAPTPSQYLGDLFDCYGTGAGGSDAVLQLNYGVQPNAG